MYIKTLSTPRESVKPKKVIICNILILFYDLEIFEVFKSFFSGNVTIKELNVKSLGI